MTCYALVKTASLGELLLTASPTHLTGIYFTGCAHAPLIQPDWKLDPAHAILQSAAAELQEFLAGQRTRFSVPLQAAGTEFQQEIWRQIAQVPFGQTITYSELARRAGAPEAIRAAGAATGRNPLSIIVPCHRIIGKSKAMRGYAGGLDRKKELLGLELKGAGALLGS